MLVNYRKKLTDCGRFSYFIVPVHLILFNIVHFSLSVVHEENAHSCFVCFSHETNETSERVHTELYPPKSEMDWSAFAICNMYANGKRTRPDKNNRLVLYYSVLY